ncbi:Uncharacterized protein Fot_42290 [Forsythia ovata]|uniref:Uncharacterized protein n=1 Tax=Forsythia ovata TaxID=205694 RepID=A0ABD1RKS6_9LAMI
MLPEKEQRAAAARRPNLPLISPPISFQNRSSQRSNTRDFEWNQTTLRKIRKTKGSERREKKGQRATATEKDQRAVADRNRGGERLATKIGSASERSCRIKKGSSRCTEKGQLRGRFCRRSRCTANSSGRPNFCEGQWPEATDFW